MKQKIFIFFVLIFVLDIHGFDIKKKTLLDFTSPANAKYRDGENVIGFNDVFLTGKPLVFFLIYYKCPTVCNTQLNSFFKAVKELNLTPGKEFHLTVLSFDHHETPELALKKKNAYMEEFEKSGKKADFRFLTGDKESIQQITDSLRFTFYFDKNEKQWVHPVGAYIYTSEGRFFRKIGGTIFQPETLYYTLAEIDPSIMNSFSKKVHLYFLRYDMMAGDYKLHTDRIEHVLIPLFLLFSGAFIFFKLYKTLKRKKNYTG
ncbi:MAG: SCO family protein [Leptospiraceae bacterium]|nr:SCO family protein [Leptospiraceae bacterium]MCK6379726.1 SCO family protein [Leptospiraceae bacterium]